MKVLILHQHFSTPVSGGPLRSYYLAKALVEEGFDPVVITAHSESQYRIEHYKGIEIHYLPVPYNNRFNFYKRSVSFMRYIYQATRLAAKFRDAKICYAMSVPLTVGLAAMWIRRRYSIPFIFEVGDLWPDAPVELGIIKNRFFKQALFALEKKIYQSALSVVALSPAIKSAVEQKVPGTIVHLIPNMADTDFYKPSLKDAKLEKKFGVTGRFVVAYIGAVGIANGLDYLVECARGCEKASLPVYFLICGDGAMLDTLKRTAKVLGLQNLAFIPFQNRMGVREVLNITDAAFISYKSFPILETGSPHKFFDGLAAGKLMIINFSGWIREEIERHHCGFACDPGNPEDFVSKITPFLSDPEKLKQYQASARLLAETAYSRRALGEHFADLIRLGA
ncbi:MAG TPA: glycosyltransferase family 4 protein [Ohtaekwangia sp.]|nr:glycosyltransferase family 4 protein [Ohtaekwangia sp.]